ncbi:hypothetical protein LUZ60_000302 [Juncus effusus]|nr:hypothetical protein LUZ60_000302 [Juncus effusus]
MPKSTMREQMGFKSTNSDIFLSQSHHFSNSNKDSVPVSVPTTQTAPANKISPAVLFIIVIVAIIFFISSLLHLLIKLLIKKRPNSNRNQNNETGSETIQRQLQQLFHLHDSGLDQSVIDSLPIFLYEEILGPKEPFDCAVCLSEFLNDDKLRLLPACGHAFHLNCIDTWLLSNSTCPLCRGSLFATTESPIFKFGNSNEEEDCEAGKLEEEKMVFNVRLGKFKNLSKIENTVEKGENGVICRETGEASSSNLNARRCFSMGSYQYILANSNLQVALSTSVRGRIGTRNVGMRNEILDGRKISAGTRGESLSVSKIWQWSNKKSNYNLPVNTSLNANSMPWMDRAGTNS